MANVENISSSSTPASKDDQSSRQLDRLKPRSDVFERTATARPFQGRGPAVG